jgi:hypothetical protein
MIYWQFGAPLKVLQAAAGGGMALVENLATLENCQLESSIPKKVDYHLSWRLSAHFT